MIKNKPVIGIIPTYNLKNEENDPYVDQAKFVTMYAKKVKESGGIPIGLLEQNLEEYMDICDGYLWPGGVQILGSFYPIIEDCIKNKKPLLGICLGMQAITTYFNILEDAKNSLKLDLETIYKENKEKNPYLVKVENEDMHLNIVTKEKESIENASHDIFLKKDSLLYHIFDCNCLSIPSMHSFTVARIPKDLQIIGNASDGTIEAVEYTKNNSFLLGIQGHVELLEDSKIFDWLVRYCHMKYQVLVNKKYALQEDNPFQIVSYQSLYPNCIQDGNIEIGVLSSWIAFRDYARDHGYFIDIESAFRTTELQQQIYEDYKKKYGLEYVEAYVAKPRHSEHETGLAIDIAMRTESGKWVTNFDEAFLECHQFLKENCAQFGFILRYPENKEEITGYHYEPWHFRYIGNEIVCKYIMENHLCLEEYFEKEKLLMKKAKF